MGQPTLTSISPSAGPPGTAITLTGAGFDPGARVGCPSLVPTTWVSAGQLTANVPADIAGAQGTAVPVAVYVRNEDGSLSVPLVFTVRMPQDKLQTWTTVEAVCGEVPQFMRGGNIPDKNILGWMRTTAQMIESAMVRRGLPVDPAAWPQPGTGADPAPAALLEMINRAGAAWRLAGAISAGFGSGEWAISKQLKADFDDHMARLDAGEYDKFFLSSAATVEPGPQLAASGGCEPAFRKEQVF